MKKILYLITQSETGGAQRYLLDLAANFKDNYNIAVAFGEQGKKGELADQLKKMGIECYTIPRLKRAISPLNDLLAIFEIIKLIKKIKPDIIHLNSSKVSILGSVAALISKLLIVNCKLLIVYTVHGWVFNEPLPKWKKLFYYTAEKFTSYFKNKIICVSKLDYEIAKSKLKIPEKKLALIHHGIKPINFLPREEAIKKLNSQFPIPNSRFLIGTIANLYKTKGLEYLIEATKILVTNYQLPVIAVVIGEGEERKNLENIIAQTNLKNNFLLAGRLNAPELLKAFDIYVCSSVKEGLSYTIMEAMHAGLPIVATNVGGNSDMIEDKKNGLLAEPQNPKDLAEKIKILIENENLRKSLGAQAKTDIKEKFGIKKMIEKTKEVYKRS